MHPLRNRLSRAAALTAALALISLLATACFLRDAAATPTATPIADIPAFLARVDDDVIEIRGIPEPPPVPYRFLNQQEMRDYLAGEFEDPETIADIEAAEALYKLLGLIPQDMVLLDTYLALLNSQVLGAYDPETEEFVVLQREGGFGPSQEITYVHEYVHRLQDAKFQLDVLTEAIENDDTSLAFTALVEGDASAVQQVYALQHLSLADIAQIAADAAEAGQTPGESPYVLRRGLEFPYIEGLAFVNRVTREGGFAAVDTAFGDPPASTEQVMHPEKYLQRENPVTVTLPEGIFSEGWTVTDENTFGEFFFKTWLEALGVNPRDSVAPAAGWGGDSYVMAENASGQDAIATLIAWDDRSSDASQFFAAMSAALDGAEGFERINTGPDIGVRVFQGPGGVLALGNLGTAEHGNVTVITAAPDQRTAMELLLAAVG